MLISSFIIHFQLDKARQVAFAPLQRLSSYTAAAGLSMVAPVKDGAYAVVVSEGQLMIGKGEFQRLIPDFDTNI